MVHRILQNQNNPELIKLLKASAAAYDNAKQREIVFTYVLIFLAVAYPFPYIIFKNEEIKESLFGISFILTVSAWFLTDYFKGNTSKGALIKEEFDVALFKLPWKFMLPKTDLAEISKLSIQYDKGRGKPIKDWYSPGIAPNIPDNTAIAICQRVSCGWDKELRAKYNAWLYGLLVIYTLAILLLWTIRSADGRTVFLLYFSTLSFYTHILTIIRGNSNVIRKRRLVIAKLDDYISNRKEFTTDNLRDIQDENYNMRQEPAKVPDFFSRKYHDELEEEFEDYVKGVNKIYQA